MIVGPADADRVFHDHAQPGPALAGVREAYFGVLDQIDIAPGLGSNTGHLLKPIKRISLNDEEGRGAGLDAHQHGTRPDHVTVPYGVVNTRLGVDLLDGFV